MEAVYRRLGDFFHNKEDALLSPAEATVCLEWLEQLRNPQNAPSAAGHVFGESHDEDRLLSGMSSQKSSFSTCLDGGRISHTERLQTRSMNDAMDVVLSSKGEDDTSVCEFRSSTDRGISHQSEIADGASQHGIEAADQAARAKTELTHLLASGKLSTAADQTNTAAVQPLLFNGVQSSIKQPIDSTSDQSKALDFKAAKSIDTKGTCWSGVFGNVRTTSEAIAQKTDDRSTASPVVSSSVTQTAKSILSALDPGAKRPESELKQVSFQPIKSISTVTVHPANQISSDESANESASSSSDSASISLMEDDDEDNDSTSSDSMSSSDAGQFDFQVEDIEMRSYDEDVMEEEEEFAFN